ncbi:uncharacterized protein LOC136763976 [Amia ocellicauda]|uniref:uncharacterized protein LOC136763976 n=1 Tax=Amia ocellicauda TaxID=2972642 RepID=UPI00346498DB
MFFNAQCSPQPAPPALPGQPQQQEILYLQIQPAQTAMGGVGLGIVSSEELQAAGGMAGFGGYIPILGGAGYAGFAGGVAGTEGIIPGGPQTGVQTAGVIPIGQGGSPVVPDVLPSGQGTLTPTLGSTIPVQGNQPAPQSRNPNTGTTPAGARSVTAQNPPAGPENPTQRPPVNNAATQRAVVKNKQVPEMDDYKASNLFP